VRLVWNRTLAWRHARWYSEKLSTNVPAANAYLTELKADPDLAFLREVSSVPLQQVTRIQQKAYTNFFTGRARYPRFKSRTGRQSAEYTRSGFRWRDGRLWLAKLDAPLAIVWSWPEVDPTSIDPSTVTVSRDLDGRWYVSLAADVDDPDPLPATSRTVGVDLGITDFAVTSDGERIANPRHLERRARNLARYQRRVARCKKGSANRGKAKAKVARAHRKVRHARQDFLHRASTNLVRRADTIVVEDLNIAGMVRRPKLVPNGDGTYARNGAAAKAGLNKSIHDVGWGEFCRQLAYKAERAGRTVVVIDRWFPSSKTCSTCGYLLAKLSLSTRAWTCPGCRTRHDRDLNAAKNIVAAGLAVVREKDPGYACGGDVRPVRATARRTPVKQETQPVKVGIPRL